MNPILICHICSRSIWTVAQPIRHYIRESRN